MEIRQATAADARALTQVLTDAIHGLAGEHYNAAQREAWAPSEPDFANWARRLLPLHTLLAEDGRGLLGFISYENNGHIELLFTAPRAARRGVATALYQRAETALAAEGVGRLVVEASLVSHAFFAGQGFRVDEEQVVERRGVMLRRHAMSKQLTP